MARKPRIRFNPSPLATVSMKVLVERVKEMGLSPAIVRHCIEWIAGVNKDATERTFQRGLKEEKDTNLASTVYQKALLRLFTGDNRIASEIPQSVRDGILQSCDAYPIGLITTSPLVRFAHVLDAVGRDPARRARIERALKIMEAEVAARQPKEDVT